MTLRAVRAAIEMRDAIPELGLRGRIGDDRRSGDRHGRATGNGRPSERGGLRRRPIRAGVDRQPTLALVREAVDVGPVQLSS
jgi:hypothetical protein